MVEKRYFVETYSFDYPESMTFEVACSLAKSVSLEGNDVTLVRELFERFPCRIYFAGEFYEQATTTATQETELPF